MATFNIGIFGHSKSGKTILGEAILFKAAVIDRMGGINQGNTLLDYEEEEKKRLMSINLATAYFNWKKNLCFLVDSPGYMDFIGEQISASYAIDLGIINIASDSGIEVGTEKSYEILKKQGIPLIIFLNKIDAEQADFKNISKQVSEWLGKKTILITYPGINAQKIEKVINVADDKQPLPEISEYRQNFLDSIAELDDSLMEKYLGGGNITQEEMAKVLKTGITNGNLIPVFSGSGANQSGIEELLDFIVEFCPDTSCLPPAKEKTPDGKDVLLERKGQEHLSGIVFKTHFDTLMGRISYLRVISGTLSANSNFYNGTKGVKDRIGQIFRMKGKKQEIVAEAVAGEIVGVTKLNGFGTFDTFSDASFPAIYEKPEIPESSLSFSITPKIKGTEDKLGNAISKIMEEDLTLKISRDNETGETIMSGMGDVHLEISLAKFKEKFGVEVLRGIPKIAYKETITVSTEAEGKFKRQTGGHGQYGHCFIRLEPLSRGKGFEFVDKIVGGAIPRQYIPSVEKGLKEAIKKGTLAGYPVVDVKATVFDGSYHVVDSSDIAFQIAASLAFQKGMQSSRPVILEPIMNVEINIPQEFVGDVIGIVNAKRGRVLEMITHSNSQLVKAQIPLAEMSNYATELRSLTSGRGSYSMTFAHYEEVPSYLAEKIVSVRKTEKEAEKT
ncbi:MAG: elongation factor G [Candidatus Omnitrophica bacterium]|nr:elongation factor G [Candidatus Omnitrophota bacterium]